MRGPKPVPILLSERQKEILEKSAVVSSPQQQVKRAQLILTMASGKNNQQTASELGVHREVMFWRARWLDAERLTAAEIALVSDQELLAMIEEAIKDELRIGTPVTFSAEQVTQIIALACSEPLAGTTNQSLSARKLRRNQTGLSKQRPAR